MKNQELKEYSLAHSSVIYVLEDWSGEENGACLMNIYYFDAKGLEICNEAGPGGMRSVLAERPCGWFRLTSPPRLWDASVVTSKHYIMTRGTALDLVNAIMRRKQAERIKRDTTALEATIRAFSDTPEQAEQIIRDHVEWTKRELGPGVPLSELYPETK